MALRASSKKTGGDADITAITRDDPIDGGVAHGALLCELVDAVIDASADPAPARQRLVAAAGPDLLVEAAAVLGMFHLNDR
ncbi:MAG TPA: alkylhydroperoxidase-related (seleno)protein, partial [Myxococcota bacterium]|nr:alkylhydroperoxidase-related (seleno)protein [Myxococcota bacterium]